jgi:pimeloyl-ACP methyl ester carboxylesterase
MKRITFICLISLVLFSFMNNKTNQDEIKFTEVKGKKHYYRLSGEGNPVVVFVSGLGPTMDDFLKIQNKISKTNQTLCYDRAGVGNSEPINNERNLKNISDELKEFLYKVIPGKEFILVGHSRGGLIVRYFANKYPENVKGLVLLDPAIPEWKYKKRTLRTEQEKIDFDKLSNSFCTDSSIYSYTIRSEFKNTYITDSALVADKGFPINLPVTMLVSSKVGKEKYNAKEMEQKFDLVKSYLKSAPHIRLVFTNRSGHFIHEDEPKLVIKEIILLLTKIK